MVLDGFRWFYMVLYGFIMFYLDVYVFYLVLSGFNMV